MVQGGEAADPAMVQGASGGHKANGVSPSLATACAVDAAAATAPPRNGAGSAANTLLPDGVEEAPAMDKAAVLGAAVWLMAQSPAHKHIFVGDLIWMIMPPIELDQFKLYRSGIQPVAFASWAKLSAEAEARLNGHTARLAPVDWASGERYWLVDLIAPFGGMDTLILDLQATALLNRTVHYHLADEHSQRQSKVFGS